MATYRHRLCFLNFVFMIGKNANQVWKDYRSRGGTLGFTDFLDREKQKMFSADGQAPGLFLVNQTLNDSVQAAIEKTLNSGGLTQKESGRTIFGVNKNIVIGGAVVITAAIILLIVKTKK
jgi:hypothetical protein